MSRTTRQTVFPAIAMAVAVLSLAACARTPEQQAVPQRVAYDCESGRIAHARYLSGDEAVVEYGGRTMTMRIAVSASGARYVGEDMEWWTKGTGPGSTGTLFRHENGVTGEAVDNCTASPEVSRRIVHGSSHFSPIRVQAAEAIIKLQAV